MLGHARMESTISAATSTATSATIRHRRSTSPGGSQKDQTLARPLLSMSNQRAGEDVQEAEVCDGERARHDRQTAQASVQSGQNLVPESPLQNQKAHGV